MPGRVTLGIHLSQNNEEIWTLFFKMNLWRHCWSYFGYTARGNRDNLH